MTKEVKAKTKSAGKSLADFRSAHDKSFIVPQKILAALKALGDGWEYEIQFMKMAGLCTTDFALYRDQFEEHIVVVNGRNPKRIWAGSKDLARKMREMT